MKERPILFNPEMVNAILSGHKTQTRRVVKDRDLIVRDHNNKPLGHVQVERLGDDVPYNAVNVYKVGDRLWVRETWKTDHIWDDHKPSLIPSDQSVFYTADDSFSGIVAFDWGKTRPNIFMPRWACRLVLEITNVRVERLQDISEEDAKAEGLKPYGPFGEWRGAMKKNAKGQCMTHNAYGCPITAFEEIWNSIYNNWSQNPWVWVVEFKVVEGV